MKEKEVLSFFKEKGALLNGHFELSSGLHTSIYFQSALVLQYPYLAARLGDFLSKFFRNSSTQVVISPAIGGIIIGQEVAKALEARSIFAERKKGNLVLRRGFKINPGERVLVIEDVITTGDSVRELIKIIEEDRAELIGVGCLVDRSGGKVSFVWNPNKGSLSKKVKFKSLICLNAETYHLKECPLCRRKIPLIKPGSRRKKRQRAKG